MKEAEKQSELRGEGTDDDDVDRVCDEREVEMSVCVRVCV